MWGPLPIMGVMVYQITSLIIVYSTVYSGADHDDVIEWKHFMLYWSFVWGIHWSMVNSPHKGQWRGALMFSLIYVWINGWVNNREAGDLRCHRTHYDITVMSKKTSELHVAGLCEGNSPVTSEFPAQMASNTENVSIWWCHHAIYIDVINPYHLIYGIVLTLKQLETHGWVLSTVVTDVLLLKLQDH